MQDNAGLIAAAASHNILPAFVIDEFLLKRWKHARFRLAFLYQSLEELESEIRKQGGNLIVEHGDPVSVIARLLDAHSVDSLFVNREYTPVGKHRDQLLADMCRDRGIGFHIYVDALLNEPEAVTKADGSPYTVFSPYYRKALAHSVPAPEMVTTIPFVDVLPHKSVSEFPQVREYLDLELPSIKPGRRGAMAALEKVQDLTKYEELRDVPAAQQTTDLSAHLRFGTCSIREAYKTMDSTPQSGNALKRQLYWRDFYTQIAFNFPHVYKKAFKPKYDYVPWDENAAKLQQWKEGRTGFPVVDAGMRQLRETGQMHNRVRMIVASFLTKNLHIDWRQGEEHFARYLIDYDPAVNNGNWQWTASTGCDAQPYFRVFNPWRQQEKFDKDCAYIKTWIPELRPFAPKLIHRLERKGDIYLPQIVDLRASAEESKRQFKQVADAIN